MTAVASARRELRLQTAPLHDRVDAVFSRADLGSRTGYERFLLAQAAAHLAVEDALTRAGAASVVTDWDDRRRAPLLRADLEQLGLTAPEQPAFMCSDKAPALLGGVYVLEGSRLGGALLKRAVAPGLPVAFLSTSDPAGWRRLLQLIDARLASAEDVSAAIDAARDVFATFERAGRQYL